MISVHPFGEHPGADHYSPDLDGAFNDGYELKPQSRVDFGLRWAFLGWCAVAGLIGSWIMLRIILTSLEGLAETLAGWIS